MRRLFTRIGLWALFVWTFFILAIVGWTAEEVFSSTGIGSAIERGEIMEAGAMIYEHLKPILEFLIGPFGVGFVAGTTLVALTLVPEAGPGR